MDFRIIRDKITIRMVNRELHQKELEDKVYREFLDLAAVYYLISDPNNPGSFATPVTKEMAKEWIVEEDELYEIAMYNMDNTMEICIKNILISMVEMIQSDACKSDMECIIEDMQELADAEERKEQMFVIADISRMNGAVALLRGDLLQKYADMLEKDLVIIPSSVHELICIRDSKNFDYDALKRVVSEVNREMVKADEVLSNNIYRYSRTERCLEIIA